MFHLTFLILKYGCNFFLYWRFIFFYVWCKACEFKKLREGAFLQVKKHVANHTFSRLIHSSTLNKLAHVVTLLSCILEIPSCNPILEIPSWNPSWHIDYLDWGFSCFPLCNPLQDARLVPEIMLWPLSDLSDSLFMNDIVSQHI
jgi:hypothetical protein